MLKFSCEISQSKVITAFAPSTAVSQSSWPCLFFLLSGLKISADWSLLGYRRGERFNPAVFPFLSQLSLQSWSNPTCPWISNDEFLIARASALRFIFIFSFMLSSQCWPIVLLTSFYWKRWRYTNSFSAAPSPTSWTIQEFCSVAYPLQSFGPMIVRSVWCAEFSSSPTNEDLSFPHPFTFQISIIFILSNFKTMTGVFFFFFFWGYPWLQSCCP